jgi:hypothetical protein
MRGWNLEGFLLLRAARTEDFSPPEPRHLVVPTGIEPVFSA